MLGRVGKTDKTGFRQVRRTDLPGFAGATARAARHGHRRGEIPLQAVVDVDCTGDRIGAGLCVGTGFIPGWQGASQLCPHHCHRGNNQNRKPKTQSGIDRASPHDVMLAWTGRKVKHIFAIKLGQ